MLTLEALRRKIESAEDLHSIVKTMKALAAVSIRQYEKAVEALVQFNRTTELGLHVLLSGGGVAALLERSAHAGRTGAIVFGSDQGMAGQFNEQIATFAIQAIESTASPGELQAVTAVGLRVMPYLEDAGLPLVDALTLPGAVSAISRMSQSLLIAIEGWRTQLQIERVFLFYNRPISGATYRSQMVRLLPIDVERLRHIETKDWPSKNLPIYTMEREELLAALIRQHLFVILSRALAESQASENAARLTAMQAAEKNIEERMGELTARYHDQRQNSITSELLDIVSGFEVLAGGR
jgi:F-type H+-transporting ATPase subunit gamma